MEKRNQTTRKVKVGRTHSVENIKSISNNIVGMKTEMWRELSCLQPKWKLPPEYKVE